MKCANPYQKTNKLGFAQEFNCGRCLSCRINRAEEWSERIMLELEDPKMKGDFLTLTYDDARSCPLLPLALAKRPAQLYFKRLRKAKNKIKYFACGEYGEKHGRAHIHAIILRGEDQPNYQKHWPWGDVHIGTVTKSSARYCTGYLTKSNIIPEGKERWPPYQLQSQGIGEKWAKDPKNNIGELEWIPRYLAIKARHKINPTKKPSRHFTPIMVLKQRHLNLVAQRFCQKP
ncbi:MAG: replication initiator protein [Microvirus sp.]|nr:MAG: replication initiator protein [Microvirus sp.]